MKTWPKHPILEAMEGKFGDWKSQASQNEYAIALMQHSLDTHAHSLKLAERWDEHQAAEHPDGPAPEATCHECDSLMRGEIRDEA